jgi:hypothetical protein
MYNFSDPDNSDDEDGLTDGFYFGKADNEKAKTEYVLEFSTETESNIFNSCFAHSIAYYN